jgi:hypothetical protein
MQMKSKVNNVYTNKKNINKIKLKSILVLYRAQWGAPYADSVLVFFFPYSCDLAFIDAWNNTKWLFGFDERPTTRGNTVSLFIFIYK